MSEREIALAEARGLLTGEEILGDLVNRDADGDGVLDWEESLWGTDPMKKDTNDDGVSDGVEIAKIKSVTGSGSSELSSEGQESETLSETDKFSREFFSTVATLNQNGVMDQTTVDTLSSSLADKIKNTPQRKVFVTSDIKIISSETSQAFKAYDNTANSVYKKYPVKKSAIEILQKFIADGEDADASALSEIDPILTQTKNVIAGFVKISVPQSLAPLHLDFVNVLQRLTENLEDIKLYEADAVVALSGISQYEKNVATLELVTSKINNIIEQKLN